MKATLLQLMAVIFFVSIFFPAQDSHFSPNDHQIPVPDCLSAAKILTERYS
jgi:hypothetical protein